MASAASAQTNLEHFYKNVQTKIIISGAVSSDYDMYARLITRAMTKYIPGNPSFTPQNMPGAGHLTATNWLYSAAPQDGSVIGMVARNIPHLALLKDPNARYDPTKFHWLGNPEVSPQICAVIAGVAVQKAEDLFDKELLIGGAGAASTPSETSNLLSRLLGMKFKLVEGYKSVPEVSLAMMRGEVHAVCQSLFALQGGNLAGRIEDGRLKVLFNFEKQRVPGLNAPSLFEFAKSDEERRILEFFTSGGQLGRPMLTPPNVPTERVAALRKAFAMAVNEPQLQEEVRRVGGKVTLIEGEALQKIVDSIMATPIDLAQKVQTLSSGKY
jgi:tripartite-type tricarboxylate transporter receptor subunit TctC